MKMIVEAPVLRKVEVAVPPAVPVGPALRWKIAAVAFIALFIGVFWYVCLGTAAATGRWMEFVSVLPLVLFGTALEVVWWWHVFFKADPER